MITLIKPIGILSKMVCDDSGHTKKCTLPFGAATQRTAGISTHTICVTKMVLIQLMEGNSNSLQFFKLLLNSDQ